MKMQEYLESQVVISRVFSDSPCLQSSSELPLSPSLLSELYLDDRLDPFGTFLSWALAGRPPSC